MPQSDWRMVLLGALVVMVPSVAVYIKTLLRLQTIILTGKIEELTSNQAKPETIEALRIEVAQFHELLTKLVNRVEVLENGKGESKASGRRATDVPAMRGESEAGTGSQDG